MSETNNYKIIEASNAETLEARVNECIIDGYVPHGHLIVTNNEGVVYTQAMYRQEVWAYEDGQLVKKYDNNLCTRINA